MAVTIQLRGDTAANWATANPVLHQRELGVETDTGKAKMGDGATAWVSLGYWMPGGTEVFSVNGHSGTVTLGPADVGADASGAAAAAQTAAEAHADTVAAAAQAAAEAASVPLSSLPLGIPSGGTGAATAAAARTALGLGTAATHPAGDFDASGAAAGALGAAEAYTDLETARAEAAESSLASGVTANATAISIETSRAQAAEGLAAQKSANLSDLASAATARTNLGLGSAATQNTFAFDAAGAYQGAGTRTWNAKLNGLACDGTTDDTAALRALLATVAAAGGGTIFFPSLALINGQVAMPVLPAGAYLLQPPIRLAGTVPSRPGEQGFTGIPWATGGLDLRYAGRTDTGCGTTTGSNVVTDTSAATDDYGQIITSPGNLPDRTYIMAVTPGVGYALNNGARATNANATFTVGGGKIQATGSGTLELDHLLLCDQGTSSQPFVLTTATTISMHDCAVLGNNAKTGATCDQDVLVAAGTGQGAALTAALTSGSVYTSLAVSALPCAILGSSPLTLTNGTATQTVTTSGSKAAGATSITVSSFTANADYGAGSAILFGGSQAPSGLTAYSTPCAPFQGYGTHVRDCFFNRTRRMGLLQTWATDVYFDNNVQWQDCGSNIATRPPTLTAGLTVNSVYTTLAVTALPAPAAVGDVLQLGVASAGFGYTSTFLSQAVTVAAPAAQGATSVTVNSFTANASWVIGTKVINTTAGICATLEVYAVPGNLSSVNCTNNHFDSFPNYNYMTRLSGPCYGSVFTGNNQNNSSTFLIALHRFDSLAPYNTVIPGVVADTAIPLLDDQTSAGGSQLVIAARGITQSSQFPWSITTPQVLGQSFLQLRSTPGNVIQLGDPTRTADVSVQNGNFSVTHLLAIGTAPTVAAASSSTSLSITGQDAAHNVQLTTAASLSPGASVATVTFGLNYGIRQPLKTPRIMVTPKNQASAAAQPYITADTQSAYAIALANPPASATAMAFDVHVIGS